MSDATPGEGHPRIAYPIIMYDRNNTTIPVTGILGKVIPEGYELTKVDDSAPDIESHSVSLKEIVGIANKEAAYASGLFDKKPGTSNIDLDFKFDEKEYVFDSALSFRNLTEEIGEKLPYLPETSYVSKVPAELKLDVSKFTEEQLLEAVAEMRLRSKMCGRSSVARVLPVSMRSQDSIDEIKSGCSLDLEVISEAIEETKRRQEQNDALLEQAKELHKETEADRAWKQKVKERLQGLLDTFEEEN